MNTEQRSKNIFTYIKTHYGETKRPDDGRSISQNVAHLNILVHDVINLLYLHQFSVGHVSTSSTYYHGKYVLIYKLKIFAD